MYVYIYCLLPIGAGGGDGRGGGGRDEMLSKMICREITRKRKGENSLKKSLTGELHYLFFGGFYRKRNGPRVDAHFLVVGFHKKQR